MQESLEDLTPSERFYVILHLTEFVRQVLHGSDDHKLWLKKASENYLDGLSVHFKNEYKK